MKTILILISCLLFAGCSDNTPRPEYRYIITHHLPSGDVIYKQDNYTIIHGCIYVVDKNGENITIMGTITITKERKN